MLEVGAPLPTRMLVFLAVASFASSVSLRAADPILPEIATDFVTTPGDAARVVTFFGAAYAIAQFTYGFIGDRYGKLRTIAAATFISGVSTLACAFVPSLDLLVFARIVVGLTAAAIIPLSMAWLGDVVPYERRQSVLARFLLGQMLGIVLGQAFSGIVAEHLGWRSVFVMIALVFLIAGAAVALELWRQGSGIVHASAAPGTARDRLVSMLRRPWVTVVLIATFFDGMLFFGAYTFVGTYLWARFGIGLDYVGLIVAGFGLGAIAYSMTAGHLVRRLGETGLMLWGGALVALAFVAIVMAPTPLAAVPATVLAGFAYYMIHNTLQTNATQMAPEARGLAVTAFASCLFLGQAAGVALAAPVYDYTGGVPVFLTAAVLLLILGITFRVSLAYRPN